MDTRLIVDSVLTLAICAFAGLAWRATRSYARLTGLALFFEHFQRVMGETGGDREASIGALRVIRKEFPDIYASMKGYMNPKDQAEIEA